MMNMHMRAVCIFMIFLNNNVKTRALHGMNIYKLFSRVSDSRVRFLWVSRGTRESRLKEAIEGSLGVVVSWWDQLRVLCYAAIGGFWTHWMYSGVPKLTFPLVWDQFLNAKMIVDTTELLARRDEVKELVKRRRACEICRGAVAKAGSSDVNIDAFIKDMIV
ncbi:hypothetical protein BRARA_D01798 [Brassica rapa]|uniref:Uncharacterized protein n=1 Tax=Brassica campestris TaxID=3711 RepID=A0A397ZUT6_BRACM|nr:hypothetical protein BRARA_D01798 [Brassica rapa]